MLTQNTSNFLSSPTEWPRYTCAHRIYTLSNPNQSDRSTATTSSTFLYSYAWVLCHAWHKTSGVRYTMSGVRYTKPLSNTCSNHQRTAVWHKLHLTPYVRCPVHHVRCPVNNITLNYIFKPTTNNIITLSMIHDTCATPSLHDVR